MSDWIRDAADRVIDEMRDNVGNPGEQPLQREYVDAFDAISNEVWGWLNSMVELPKESE